MGRKRKGNRRGRHNNNNPKNGTGPRHPHQNLDRDEDYPMHGVDTPLGQATGKPHGGARNRKLPRSEKPRWAPGQTAQWTFPPGPQDRRYRQGQGHANNRGRNANQNRHYNSNRNRNQQQPQPRRGRRGRGSFSSSAGSDTSSSPAASLLGVSPPSSDGGRPSNANPFLANPFALPHPYPPPRFCGDCRAVRRANLRFRDWAAGQLRRGLRRVARWSEEVGVGFGAADEMDWQPEPVIRVLILEHQDAGGFEDDKGGIGVDGSAAGGYAYPERRARFGEESAAGISVGAGMNGRDTSSSPPPSRGIPGMANVGEPGMTGCDGMGGAPEVGPGWGSAYAASLRTAVFASPWQGGEGSGLGPGMAPGGGSGGYYYYDGEDKNPDMWQRSQPFPLKQPNVQVLTPPETPGV
ncbi:hypothetical protein F4810DRAFT_110097 [Camillea tinctor]|nr:hypothetical protein F4810DRAFT_110097 [Camillea tinctor]